MAQTGEHLPSMSPCPPKLCTAKVSHSELIFGDLPGRWGGGALIPGRVNTPAWGFLIPLLPPPRPRMAQLTRKRERLGGTGERSTLVEKRQDLEGRAQTTPRERINGFGGSHDPSAWGDLTAAPLFPRLRTVGRLRCFSPPPPFPNPRAGQLPTSLLPSSSPGLQVSPSAFPTPGLTEAPPLFERPVRRHLGRGIRAEKEPRRVSGDSELLGTAKRSRL